MLTNSIESAGWEGRCKDCLAPRFSVHVPATKPNYRLLMWCKHCRQDVPGIHSSASASLSCARCGAVLAAAAEAIPRAGLADAAEHGFDLTGAAGGGSATEPDAWELDQKVRRLQAKTGSRRRIDRPSTPVAHVARAVPGRHVGAGMRAMRAPARAVLSQITAQGSIEHARLGLLSLGLMAFACGVALLVWSFVERRDELWSLGLPIAVGGQVGLLLGLVLQLERVWQNSRDAVSRLERVDTQLQDLERQQAAALSRTARRRRPFTRTWPTAPRRRCCWPICRARFTCWPLSSAAAHNSSGNGVSSSTPVSVTR